MLASVMMIFAVAVIVLLFLGGAELLRRQMETEKKSLQNAKAVGMAQQALLSLIADPEVSRDLTARLNVAYREFLGLLEG